MEFSQTNIYATEILSTHQFNTKAKEAIQWWYFTGHLWDGIECKADFKTFPPNFPRYGVQATFFFNQEPGRTGMLGHAAESRLSEKSFENTARFDVFQDGSFSTLASRVQLGALNLKLFDWSFVELKPPPRAKWFLSFSLKGINYELLLEPESEKNLWLHGEKGFVQKVDGDSNFYATIPFVKAYGVRTNSRDSTTTPVCGSLWFDHEFGVENVATLKWNWFAARFRNGDAYMFYALSRGASSKVIGEVFSKTGRKLQDVKVEMFDEQCLVSKRCYPQRFAITFRDKGKLKTMLVKNSFAEQEHSAEEPFKTYWEGSASVELEGNVGFGYVEMAR